MNCTYGMHVQSIRFPVRVSITHQVWLKFVVMYAVNEPKLDKIRSFRQGMFFNIDFYADKLHFTNISLSINLIRLCFLDKIVKYFT